MKAVVTGAAGFLGGHVARHFRDGGWDVVGFDQAPVDISGVEAVQGDLLDPESLRGALDGVDVVCHLGAIGDVYLAGEKPALAAGVNVVGTANVIDAALHLGTRVVYASTWEVYGEPEYEPIDENHRCRPDHPYNITKLAGESLLLSAAELRGLPAVALRLGTAYGVGLRPNSVFRIFIDKARRGEPITVQGGGAQGRQFTHASDIARAFDLAARSDISGFAFNTVADDLVTIKQLADLVVESLPTELTYGPARTGDVPSALVSSDLITERLGWRPQVLFEEAVQELIAEDR